MTVALEAKVEEYNNECGDQCAKVMTTSSGKQLVAICSPFMKRVHMHLKHSGEMCFMDASGNMDRDHWRVFLLLTHSVAGGLPLGILISPTEDEQVIFEGLELLKTLLDDRSFSGRGKKGPAVFLTDDSRAEQGALRRAFPQAKRVLCLFLPASRSEMAVVQRQQDHYSRPGSTPYSNQRHALCQGGSCIAQPLPSGFTELCC